MYGEKMNIRVCVFRLHEHEVKRGNQDDIWFLYIGSFINNKSSCVACRKKYEGGWCCNET